MHLNLSLLLFSLVSNIFALPIKSPAAHRLVRRGGCFSVRFPLNDMKLPQLIRVKCPAGAQGSNTSGSSSSGTCTFIPADASDQGSTTLPGGHPECSANSGYQTLEGQGDVDGDLTDFDLSVHGNSLGSYTEGSVGQGSEPSVTSPPGQPVCGMSRLFPISSLLPSSPPKLASWSRLLPCFASCWKSSFTLFVLHLHPQLSG